jgi:ketopantoate reductase
MTDPPRVTIVGRGAVATACAARLAAAGVHVVMPESRRSSVILTSGSRTIEAPVAHSPHPRGSELLLFAVKAYQLEEKLRRYKRHVAETPVSIFLGNGLVNGWRGLVAPAIFEGTVNLIENGHAELHSLTAIRSPVAADKLGRPVMAALRDSLAFEPVAEDVFQLHKLKKFAIACTSARMALLGLTIGAALGDSDELDGLRAVAREALSILGTPYGAALYASSERLLDEAFLAWERPEARGALARAETSLHADLRRRSGSTEIDWLNGAVAVAARESQRPAPLNTFLAGAVRRLAERRLTPEDAAADAAFQKHLRGFLHQQSSRSCAG